MSFSASEVAEIWSQGHKACARRVGDLIRPLREAGIVEIEGVLRIDYRVERISKRPVLDVPFHEGSELTDFVLPRQHLTAHIPYRLCRINLRAQREKKRLRDTPCRLHRTVKQLSQRRRDVVTARRSRQRS
jgi:hypothetical protein